VVAVPARTWRPYLLPAAFLLAVTLGVVGIRAALHHSTTPTRPHVAHHAHTKSVYIVRPGDTLGGRSTVTDVQPSSKDPRRGTVYTTNEVFNQDGALVMTLKARGFFARRSAQTGV